jgi:hypothetical protein
VDVRLLGPDKQSQRKHLTSFPFCSRSQRQQSRRPSELALTQQRSSHPLPMLSWAQPTPMRTGILFAKLEASFLAQISRALSLESIIKDHRRLLFVPVNGNPSLKLIPLVFEGFSYFTARKLARQYSRQLLCD